MPIVPIPPLKITSVAYAFDNAGDLALINSNLAGTQYLIVRTKFNTDPGATFNFSLPAVGFPNFIYRIQHESMGSPIQIKDPAGNSLILVNQGGVSIVKNGNVYIPVYGSTG